MEETRLTECLQVSMVWAGEKEGPSHYFFYFCGVFKSFNNKIRFFVNKTIEG